MYHAKNLMDYMEIRRKRVKKLNYSNSAYLVLVDKGRRS
jgi:hypothetical protein